MMESPLRNSIVFCTPLPLLRFPLWFTVSVFRRCRAWRDVSARCKSEGCLGSSFPRRDRGCPRAQLGAVGGFKCCYTHIEIEDLVIGVETVHSAGRAFRRNLALNLSGLRYRSLRDASGFRRDCERWPGLSIPFHSKEWLLVIHGSSVLLPLITTTRVLFLNLKIYHIH